MVSIYLLRTNPELRAELDRLAMAEGLELNRFLTRELAKLIGRPDLGFVPLLRRGPKGKKRRVGAM